MQRTAPSEVRIMSILLIKQVNTHFFSDSILHYLCNLLSLAFSLNPRGFPIFVVFSGLVQKQDFQINLDMKRTSKCLINEY